VRDDGPGLAEEPAVSGGVGLSNTRRRLSVLYGSRQSVTLRNIVSGGAESIVELPLEPTQRETLSGDLWVDEVRPHALTDGRDGA